MKRDRALAAALVIALCAGAVFAVRTLRPDAEAALKKRLVERTVGDPKASLWITEYFDYQCPPCANARLLLEKAMTDHPGRIHLQVRYFPLPLHLNAMKAAIYAECATRQKGKFWKFHEELFNHQPEWAMDPYATIKFAEYATKAGLDVKKLDACSHDPEIEASVADEKKKAQELGVQITPTFFLNGKIVVGSKTLVDEINTALAAQPAPTAEPAVA